MNRNRREAVRHAVLALAGAAAADASWAAAASSVQPGRVLRFPQDHGAHPDTRIEWWYATGAVLAAGDRLLGFQLTFFRSRTGLAVALAGRFAPRQLLFGHAAITDLRSGRHVHGERLARWSGTPDPQGYASAALDDTDLRLGDWQFRREVGADGPHYRARLGRPGRDALALDLRLQPTQPVLLQGGAGFSRKGPQPQQASHYYSQPQLATEGRLSLGAEGWDVHGRAWLDHEWSDEILPPQAVGWDWIGFNLDDGSALTAFRLRTREGTALWAGGSWRAAGGEVQAYAPDAVRFTPLAWWTSPTSRARYPVRWRVEVPQGAFEVRSLLDAQELDSRRSTGAVYWEGLSELRDADAPQRVRGLGYLEMTGYVEPLRLG